MKIIDQGLIIVLACLSVNLGWAAAPPGKAVTPAIALQGGSSSTIKWGGPESAPYKVHVFVPNTGKVTNSLYRVYPKGKRSGSTTCLSTDIQYPCFEVTVDQSQHRNTWVQLTQNDDPETQWTFTKTKGYVAAVADNLDQETSLNVSTQIRFEIQVTIGQSLLGGIIFYIDNSGQHGLVAAPNDQSTGIAWWNGSYVFTNATSTAVGKGKTNTREIIWAQGAGSYAASLADSLILNGYADWFLPSLGELDLMYRNIGPAAPKPLAFSNDT